MILGKKFVERKNHWKVYLLILLGLVYNLQLAFQIHPITEVQKPEMRISPILPDSSFHLRIAADSLKNKEILTQRIEKL